MIKVIVYLAAITDKFLERCYLFETLHRSFSSSKWQM